MTFGTLAHPDSFVTPLAKSANEKSIQTGTILQRRFAQTIITGTSQIAEEIGYDNPLYFSRIFQRTKSIPTLNNQTPASCYYPILLLDDHAA